MGSRPDWSLRHRAAFCHLALWPLLSALWLPWLLGREQDDFVERHAHGAMAYQGLTLLLTLLLWILSYLPALWFGEVAGRLFNAGLGVFAACLIGTLYLGSFALATQAWNGDPFWAPGLSAWLDTDERSPE